MKGALNTNSILEKNFANVSTTRASSSFLQSRDHPHRKSASIALKRLEHLVETSEKFFSEIKLVFREPFNIVYARAN